MSLKKKFQQYTMEQEKQQQDGSSFSQRLLAEQAKFFDASQLSVIQESFANLHSNNNNDVKATISKLHEVLNGNDGRGLLDDATAASIPVDDTMVTAWIQDPLSMVEGLMLAMEENDTKALASYKESAKAALKKTIALLNDNDDGAIGIAQIPGFDPAAFITWIIFLTGFPSCVIFAGLPQCAFFTFGYFFCEVLSGVPGKDEFCADFDNNPPGDPIDPIDKPFWPFD